jgi:hypothetical protein
VEAAADHLVSLFGADEDDEDAYVGALLVAELLALVRSLGKRE